MSIVAVEQLPDSTSVIVRFSAAMVWNGVDLPAAFMAYTIDGFMESPLSVVAVGADWMELEFNAVVEAGAPWELNAAMEGITPAVAFPQSGVVS